MSLQDAMYLGLLGNAQGGYTTPEQNALLNVGGANFNQAGMNNILNAAYSGNFGLPQGWQNMDVRGRQLTWNGTPYQAQDMASRVYGLNTQGRHAVTGPQTGGPDPMPGMQSGMQGNTPLWQQPGLQGSMNYTGQGYGTGNTAGNAGTTFQTDTGQSMNAPSQYGLANGMPNTGSPGGAPMGMGQGNYMNPQMGFRGMGRNPGMGGQRTGK